MAAHLHALHTLTLVFVLNYVPCLGTRDPFRPLPPLGCIYQVASKSGAIAKVRKFYKDVSVVEADTVGYGVALDGRRIKTPKGVHLTVPTEMLVSNYIIIRLSLHLILYIHICVCE